MSDCLKPMTADQFSEIVKPRESELSIFVKGVLDSFSSGDMEVAEVTDWPRGKDEKQIAAALRNRAHADQVNVKVRTREGRVYLVRDGVVV